MVFNLQNFVLKLLKSHVTYPRKNSKSYKGVSFDSPQQLIPNDLACITSRIIISILELTRKLWSFLVPKKLIQPSLWLLDYTTANYVSKKFNTFNLQFHNFHSCIMNIFIFDLTYIFFIYFLCSFNYEDSPMKYLDHRNNYLFHSFDCDICLDYIMFFYSVRKIKTTASCVLTGWI